MPQRALFVATFALWCLCFFFRLPAVLRTYSCWWYALPAVLLLLRINNRFKDKRHRRNWTKKQTSYSCRKDFAEARPRVRGRFVPKDQVRADSDSKSLATRHWSVLATSDRPMAVGRRDGW